jgi:hypothetical protein
MDHPSPGPGVIAARNLSCCTTFDVLGHKLYACDLWACCAVATFGAGTISGGCD